MYKRQLSKLLLGTRPAEALRIARVTGALAVVVPELAATFGYAVASPRQPLTLDDPAANDRETLLARAKGLAP